MFGLSIALAPQSRKRKQAKIDAANTKLFVDAILFTNGFQEATDLLARVF